MTLITDQSRINQIRESIREGSNLLRSGLNVLGKPLSIEERGMIRRQVFKEAEKIGEGLSSMAPKGYTIEDVTPAGYGPE